MEKGIPSGIYKKKVLELYKNPSNFGQLKNPTYEHTSYNSICGDEITVNLIVKDGIVKDAKFSGSGCVISLVAASSLIDKIKGMKIVDIQKINKQTIQKLLRVKINPSRVKCALLPLDALRGALKNG